MPDGPLPLKHNLVFPLRCGVSVSLGQLKTNKANCLWFCTLPYGGPFVSRTAFHGLKKLALELAGQVAPQLNIALVAARMPLAHCIALIR